MRWGPYDERPPVVCTGGLRNHRSVAYRAAAGRLLIHVGSPVPLKVHMQ